MTSAHKILVTGANGQVGHELLFALQDLGAITATDRVPLAGAVPAGVDFAAVDLTDSQKLIALIEAVRPDAIVHSAAYTAVDKAESEQDLAFAINRDAVAVISKTARTLGIPVVSYSTDYVFAGDGVKPWSETDCAVPLGIYGATKLAGEKAVESSGALHVTLRTSWIFSDHGVNFVKTMLRLAKEKTALRVVSDQVGAPTSAAFLARMTRAVLERGFSTGNFASFSGTYHLACSGETSWHGFAEAIISRAKALGFPIVTESIEAIPSEAYPTAAKRPKNSRLDCRKFLATFDARQGSWTDELDAVLVKLLPTAK